MRSIIAIFATDTNAQSTINSAYQSLFDNDAHIDEHQLQRTNNALLAFYGQQSSEDEDPLISIVGDRYVIAYSGKIYNFEELCQKLDNAKVTTSISTDAELLLALYEQKKENMLPMIRGMFAFVILDKVENHIFAARDPYGIMPLFVHQSGSTLIFSSHVKTLFATGLVSDKPDLLGQTGYWLLGSVPEPNTWFEDIQAIPAGGWCQTDKNNQLDGPHIWCDIGDYWRNAPKCDVSVEDAQRQVRTAVFDSLQKHLSRDESVAIFLSGGIDSGSLAGLMKDAGAKNIKAITLAYSEFDNTHRDEAANAAIIARQYGLEHHIRRVNRSEFEADLPLILKAMDQPSIDGVNTWFGAKAAAELGIKTIISGVGGDELFCGYNSFRQLPKVVRWWNRLNKIPGAKRITKTGSNLMALRSGNAKWGLVTQNIDSLPGAFWIRRGIYYQAKLKPLMSQMSEEERAKLTPISNLIKSLTGPLPHDSIAAIGLMESSTYLRNQLLRDTEWASNAHGVEILAPLVDVWLLRDLAPLLRGFSRLHGKRLLAQTPSTPLPEELISRKKTGFGIPVTQWLRESTPHGASESGAKSWADYVAEEFLK